MAAKFKSPSVAEFGLIVEKMSAEKRAMLLAIFYRDRRALLERLGLDHEDEGL
jgi:hypothetical protein